MERNFFNILVRNLPLKCDTCAPLKISQKAEKLKVSHGAHYHCELGFLRLFLFQFLYKYEKIFCFKTTAPQDETPIAIILACVACICWYRNTNNSMMRGWTKGWKICQQFLLDVNDLNALNDTNHKCLDNSVGKIRVMKIRVKFELSGSNPIRNLGDFSNFLEF